MANYIQGLTPVSKFWLAVGGAAVGYAYYRRNQVLADPRSHYQFYERDLDYTTKNGPRYSLGYGETGREPTGAPSASGVSQNLKVKEQVQKSIETGQPTQSGAVVSRKPVAPQQQQQQEQAQQRLTPPQPQQQLPLQPGFQYTQPQPQPYQQQQPQQQLQQRQQFAQQQPYQAYQQQQRAGEEEGLLDRAKDAAESLVEKVEVAGSAIKGALVDQPKAMVKAAGHQVKSAAESAVQSVEHAVEKAEQKLEFGTRSGQGASQYQGPQQKQYQAEAGQAPFARQGQSQPQPQPQPQQVVITPMFPGIRVDRGGYDKDGNYIANQGYINVPESRQQPVSEGQPMVAPAQPPAITTSSSQGPQQQQQPGQVSTLTAAIGDLEAVVSDAKRHAEYIENQMRNIADRAKGTLSVNEAWSELEEVAEDAREHASYIAEQIEHYGRASGLRMNIPSPSQFPSHRVEGRVSGSELR